MNIMYSLKCNYKGNCDAKRYYSGAEIELIDIDKLFIGYNCILNDYYSL
ncbi:MAG: hypothetical protein ACM3S4_04040 [Burkholderiales bacterium]